MNKPLIILSFYLFLNTLLISQWSKEYGDNEASNFVNDILAVDDGYYISAGHNYRLWLLKTDLNGDTVWTKKYSDIGYSKIIDSKTNGLFLLNENYANHMLQIVKIDYSGNIIWERNFLSLKDYSSTNDNSFLILNTENANYLKLLKLNEFGDTSWSKYYTFTQIYRDNANLYNFGDNGNVIAIFDTYYGLFKALKIDNNGDSLWTTTIDSIYQNSLYVNQNVNGDFYFGGNSERQNYGLNGNSYLIKLDSDGNHLKSDFTDDYYWAQIMRNDSTICKILRSEKKIILTDRNHNTIWENDYSDLLNISFFPTPKYVTNSNDILFSAYDPDFGGLLFKMDSDGEFIWQNYFAKDSLSLISGKVLALSEDDFILANNTLETQSKKTNFKLINFQTPTKVELIVHPQFYYNSKTNENEIIFHDSIDVRMVSNIFEAEIYYTLDGSQPNEQSNLFSKPFRLDSNATVKAIGISSQYENSEVIEKEYQFYQKFTVEMAELYEGIDSNFVGKAIVDIEIPMPIAPLGEVSSLKWRLSNSVIGEGNILSYSFPVGTNEVILETSGSWGNIQFDTTQVTVYSAKRKRDIEYYEFNLNKRISPSAQLNNGNIILSTTFDSDRYNARPAILDSSLNFKWTGIPYTYSLSTPCVIDDKNILFAFEPGIMLHFEDSLSNDYYIKDINRINERVVTSPSYSTDSLLFIGTLDGKIVSAHLSNFSEVLWEFECGDSILSDIVIDENDNLIFGCNDNYLYSLDIEGNLNWKFNVGDKIKSTAALGLDSTIVFGADNGYLYKLNNNGKEIWNYKIEGAIKSSPVIDFYGNIYFGSADGNLYSLSTNGNLNWKFNTDAKKEPFASLGNNGLVYVNDGLNMMYALDISGNIKWYFKLAQQKIAGDNFQDLYEEIFGAPMVTDNNLIFLRTTFGQFYMFKDDFETNEAESLLPQWAAFKGSNKRTGKRMSDFPSNINIDSANEIVKTHELKQNYPNPFNPTTKIKYFLPERTNIKITVFNILGSEMKELVNEVKESGNYEIIFNGSDLASGVYFYRINTEKFIQTKKMVLLR
jgi:hypothetical protein